MKFSELEKQLLSSAAGKAMDYLEQVEGRKVAPSSRALQNVEAFDEELSFEGADPMETIDFLHQYGSPATMASNGGRYFGFVIGGSLHAALAANWLATAWDQNAGLGITSPVNAKIEAVAEKWLVDILPVSKGSCVGFVTGVTMANFAALAAARTAILDAFGWDVESDGLYGAPEITVIIGDEAHGSLLKALALLGFGRKRVVRVATDANGRMRKDLIPSMNERTILCLQAGNVNTGGMDSGDLIEIAKQKNAWVHIDGAFGLWAGASKAKKYLTKGYELADSWATDGHKWLNVPYDSGLVICRSAMHLRKAMSMEGDYLDQSGDRIPYQYTPELSRKARAIDVWAALRTLGRDGIDDLVTRTCSYAEHVATRIRDAGFEILNQIETNQVLISFGADEVTKQVINNIQAEGTCWCGGTVWKGKSAMRISISSAKTTLQDVDQAVDSMLAIGKECVKKNGR